MNWRADICFSLSRRLLKAPEVRTIEYEEYDDWRQSSLAASYGNFSEADITGKRVLDFGCGDGQLSIYLGKHLAPKSIIGVDLVESAIDRAKRNANLAQIPKAVETQFILGSVDTLPVDDHAVDTVLAFDCLEHVMQPVDILNEWYRVLHPGGRVLIEWFPFKGPWGPHMESLIPIPWAHVIFGERAMFKAAARIYDLPEFVPRHWDLDSDARKKPNKWKAWSTFNEQAFINQLDTKTFRRLALKTGFQIDRFEQHSFSGSLLRRGIGHCCMLIPIIGEYFVSYTLVELRRPK